MNKAKTISIFPEC